MAINSRGGIPQSFIAERIERNASLDTYKMQLFTILNLVLLSLISGLNYILMIKNTSKFAISPAQVKVGKFWSEYCQDTAGTKRVIYGD